MASVQNRSRWEVSTPSETKTFRLRKEAEAYLTTLPASKKNSLKQLENSFEAQIKLIDKDGNQIKQTQTHSTYALAEEWATKEEKRLLTFKKENGKFDFAFENMTFEDALTKTCHEHYKNKASYKGMLQAVPHIIEKIGRHILLKEVNQAVLLKYRRSLEADGYAPSSIRNFFVLISATFKQASMEWLFPVQNYAKMVKLEKPDNAIERNWEGKDEQERLFESIQKNAPWLLPIVEMSLQMAFRMGELVKRTKSMPDDEFYGLQWKGVSFEEGTVRIFREKNDWKKQVGETKGRTVPMTSRMREILIEAHGPLDIKRTGPVFQATHSSVSTALKTCCQKADPPIENFSFHSLRKIGTYQLHKIVNNVLLLGKLTGHRDLLTLSRRYFKPEMDDLKALVNINDERDILKRGLVILKNQLGESGLQLFLDRINEEVKKELERNKMNMIEG